MTESERQKIKELRIEGVGYGAIASALSLTKAQVSSYCRRKKIVPARTTEDGGIVTGHCRNCGKEIYQKKNTKNISFCSKECCKDWWNHHPEEVNRRPGAIYSYECAYCGKPFTAYGNDHRKYCCHKCYIKDRFGGDHDD